MATAGWPKRKTKIALSLSPTLLAAQIATTESALGRNHIERAKKQDRRLPSSATLYPEKQSVRQLNTDLAAETGWQLQTRKFALPTPNAAGASSAMPAMARLKASFNVHSPLIDDKWRLFGGC